MTILVGFLLMTVLTLSQFGMVATLAQAATAPVTTPVITPVSYFTYYIRGKITYRFLRVFPRPASNIVVIAKNLSNNDSFAAKTGTNGTYTLEVRQASASALYTIKPKTFGAKNIKWNPREYKKSISKDLRNIDFVGTKISK